MTDSVYVKFEDLSRPLLLRNCSALLDHFPLIFPGWKISTTESPAQTPVIRIEGNSKGSFGISAEWLDKTAEYDDEVDALCALIAKVVKARTLEDTNLLCLHGAAVEVGGKLIIFPNRYRAGKSVLAVCMAAAGFRVYSDDVLPISLDSGAGIAPAIAPRLRYPYPENLEDETRRFIESRAALRGKRYHYLDLAPDLLAARGSRADVGAFVFLERTDGVRADLQPISESEVLRQVVWQNFAREADAPATLGRLGQLVNRAQRFMLRYERADDAVALLAAGFRQFDAQADSPPRETLELESTEAAAIEIPAGYLLRRHGLSVISSEGNAFLADASGCAIHHLNPVGSAIWNLLAQPITAEQIVDLMLIAFPDAGRSRIETDVGDLLGTLRTKNLLLEGPRRVGVHGSG